MPARLGTELTTHARLRVEGKTCVGNARYRRPWNPPDASLHIITGGWKSAKGVYTRKRPNRETTLVEDQHRGRDHRGPQAAFVAHRGLRHVGGAHDLVGEAVNLFFFVPGSVGIEFHVERGGEHFGGEFFGVFSGRILGLPKGVMFTEISIGGAVGGDGDSDRGR